MPTKAQLTDDLDRTQKALDEMRAQLEAANEKQTVMLSARVPRTLRERAKAQALRQGVSLQSYLAAAINSVVTADEQDA